VTVLRDKFRKNNQLDASKSKIYFRHKTLQFQPHSAGKRSHNLHEAYQLPCVQWITPDDGHRRCPKHVGFYDENKFWILMHLVGYFNEKKIHFHPYVSFVVSFGFLNHVSNSK
jgi:hypothetical protein